MTEAEILRLLKIRDGFDSRTLTPAQRACLSDRSRRKVATCTRRSGKTIMLMADALRTACAGSRRNILYLGVTRESCKRIVLNDALVRLNPAGRLAASELTWVLPNESRIILLGADQADRVRTIRGTRYHLAVIDEAQDLRIDLAALIEEVLAPAVAEVRGTIWLAGTPNGRLGHFREVAGDVRPTVVASPLNGWSRHSWSWRDNPHVASTIREELAARVAADPTFASRPRTLREYEGEWVSDSEQLVYWGFSRCRNSTASPPPSRLDIVIGLDPGFRDPTGIVVGGLDKLTGVLHYLHSESLPETLTDTVGRRLKALMEEYGARVIVADPASRQVLEDLRSRWKLPIVNARKVNKEEAVSVLNSHFSAGRVLVHRAADSLAREYEALHLVPPERSSVWAENPADINNEADSALYLARYLNPGIFDPESALDVQPREEDDPGVPDFVRTRARPKPDFI